MRWKRKSLPGRALLVPQLLDGLDDHGEVGGVARRLLRRLVLSHGRSLLRHPETALEGLKSSKKKVFTWLEVRVI